MFKRKERERDNDGTPLSDCMGLLQFLTSDPEMARSCETLLSSLQILISTIPFKALLVTSAQPGEGKTTITLALAATMQLAGKKVIVVDADLRKPRIHEMLKLRNDRGVSDALCGERGFQEVIQRVSHGPSKQTLDVITSGKIPSNYLQMMTQLRLKPDIEYLRNIYDMVLIDSPPALSVSDSLLLAPMVDGIILVLRTGFVTEKDARLAKERLEQAGGHLLGVVMNRFVARQHGTEFHPYRHYYVMKT